MSLKKKSKDAGHDGHEAIILNISNKDSETLMNGYFEEK